MTSARTAAALTLLLSLASAPGPAAAGPAIAVGAQYDTTHVYVAPADLERFTDSFVATFGGSKSQQGVFQVTPTPSQTLSQVVRTPAGPISVFGFKTPIPFPFGVERTGYLVTDLDVAVKAAEAHGADVIVEPFADPIGRDAIIEWPGGVFMQLYWHTQKPSSEALATVPENRVYLSRGRADEFIRDFVAFAHGTVIADERTAPGIEIGRPADHYRSVRITSSFGKMNVLVTDGALPYPYGREITGYEVPSLAEVLDKARVAGVEVLVAPFASRDRESAVVKFPGGYVAELHSVSARPTTLRQHP